MMVARPCISPALSECGARLRTTVEQFIDLINVLIAVAMGHESAKGVRAENEPIPDHVTKVLPLMLQALGSSGRTLTRLSTTSGLHTRDCYSIVRSIVELAINICYILAEGSNAAERAIRHARYLSYKDLARESQISKSIISLSCSYRPDVSQIEGLEADIADFTSKTGRDKSWVELSVDKRIEVSGEKLGEGVLNSLHSARFMVYRHSSEVLHGTFFSALYFFGLTLPSSKQRTADEMMEAIAHQHNLILGAAILALSAVVEGFHKACGFLWAYERSRSLAKSLQEIPFLQGNEAKV